MSGKRFSEKERNFRRYLRNKVCKPRLDRWAAEAGLTDRERTFLLRQFLNGDSRFSIGVDYYSCEVTVSRHITKGVRKIMDYLESEGLWSDVEKEMSNMK